ncbi:MAG: hypothetical protein PHR78_03680 [Eubacteriales bacterium]|nr:hypothetical protein [Eubacteriales bacterium]MDD4323359.1 hypothetical protein [Eubacteriales bacterium]MDD4541247.1 hypothetical protein [Eubacteriales bacterium]
MKRRILVILVAALASLVSIPVGDTDFRITLGIIVMVAGIQIFSIDKVIGFSFWTGLAVCLARIAYAAVIGINITPLLIGSYFLEIFFYLGYGIIYHFAIANIRTKYPVPLVVSLVLCDFGGNSLEYLMRFFYASEVWSDTSLLTLLLAALTRSVVIVLLVWILKRFGPKSIRTEEVVES